VSGGCVEDDLIARIKAGQTTLQAGVIAYGVSQEEAARFGLPCGGTLRLVQEPLLETHWVQELLQRTANHELVARTLNISTGAVTVRRAQRGEALQFDGETLTTLFGPKWRLLLIGAGQLSQAVASIAQLLDFEVLVCDPREEYTTTLKHNLDLQGVRHVAGMPDDVVVELKPDAHTAVVALTHDSKLDDMALMEALNSEAFYVGALGSKRNQTTRKARLMEHFGMTELQLSKLHGPVGLNLGAKTPAEIAVSIVAQIVQQKYALTIN
jgi:xanthine dehydrogenase accessory factor